MTEPSSAIRIEAYRAEHRALWNDFVRRAKNGVFLFDRDYMEYHADRFTDASLVMFAGDKLCAVMPASRKDDVVVSHGGLTFGGVVSDDRMRSGRMVELFARLAEHLATSDARRLVYKAIPHIYHSLPAEEDLYALFRSGAKLVRRDIAAALPHGASAGYTKGRKWATKRGRASGIEVSRSDAFEEFMAIEEAQLIARHGVKPVHSAAEMRLLASRFPDNIKLFVAAKNGRILAGTIIYESRQVAHAQYIAQTDEGRELFAPDVLTDSLLTDTYAAKPWFDFGISTEEQGQHLNEGLMENKESYGARAVVYDFYEMEIAP